MNWPLFLWNVTWLILPQKCRTRSGVPMILEILLKNMKKYMEYEQNVMETVPECTLAKNS